MHRRLLREAIRAIVLEINDESLYEKMLTKYPNIPAYVMHDMFVGQDEKFFPLFNKLTWKLQVIEVNPTHFSDATREKFVLRDFGVKNPFQVPNDEERMQVQRKLASDDVPGRNEPVILVQRIDGYEIWEGWHRTMSILQRGNNGLAPSDWDPVRIKAWVGIKSTA